MKKYGLLILAMVLLAVGCQRQPIDKQEADAIVTKYIKKNFKANDNIERAVYYCNRLNDERIELSFWYEEDEDIIAENAFVYCIDENFDAPLPHAHRIILVQKENGKYTVSIRSTRPYVKSDNYWYWNWLYSFVNGQFLN